jgi:hypothetical protein
VVLDEEKRHGVTAKRTDLTLGKVDDACGTEDEDEAERNECVDQALDEAGEDDVST